MRRLEGLWFEDGLCIAQKLAVDANVAFGFYQNLNAHEKCLR